MRRYDIDYTPPGYEVLDYKTGKAVKTKGEFEAVDSDPIPDYDGSIADYEPRVLDDVDEIMSSDARRMEAYATGKSDKDIPIKSGEVELLKMKLEQIKPQTTLEKIMMDQKILPKVV